jgi:hypothetical protein
MTEDKKQALLEKLEEATRANRLGDYYVANLLIQDARAMLYAAPGLKECLPLVVKALGVAYTNCGTALESELAAVLQELELVFRQGFHPEYPLWEPLLLAHNALFLFQGTHPFNVEVHAALYELTAVLVYEATSAKELGHTEKAQKIGALIWPAA